MSYQGYGTRAEGGDMRKEGGGKSDEGRGRRVLEGGIRKEG